MNGSLSLQTTSVSEISKDKKQFSELGDNLREVIVYFRLWFNYIFEYRIFLFKKYLTFLIVHNTLNYVVQ